MKTTGTGQDMVSPAMQRATAQHGNDRFGQRAIAIPSYTPSVHLRQMHRSGVGRNLVFSQMRASFAELQPVLPLGVGRGGGGGHGGGHGHGGGGGGHGHHGGGHRFGGRGWGWDGAGWGWGDWPTTLVVYDCPPGYYYDDNGNCVPLTAGLSAGDAAAYATASPQRGSRLPAPPNLPTPHDAHSSAQAPLVAQSPHSQRPHHQDTFQPPRAQSASQAYTSSLREQALPMTSLTSGRRPRPPGYQAGGLHGRGGQSHISRSTSMPILMPRGVAGLPVGFGAAASAFTVQAAAALDQQLANFGNAGCNDPRSALRQLTFTFKAACLTDPAVQNSVNLNMTTPIAMTGYGPGSDTALSLVLGASRTYQGGAVTDDQGNCNSQNGSMPTPIIPPNMTAAANAVVSQIMLALQNVPVAQQSQVITNLTTLLGQFLGMLAAANIGQSATPVVVTTPPPKYNLPNLSETSTTTTTTSAPMSTTSKVIIGGLIGAAVLGGAVLITKHVTKKGH
jgi:hypothetical protein